MSTQRDMDQGNEVSIQGNEVSISFLVSKTSQDQDVSKNFQISCFLFLFLNLFNKFKSFLARNQLVFRQLWNKYKLFSFSLNLCQQAWWWNRHRTQHVLPSFQRKQECQWPWQEWQYQQWEKSPQEPQSMCPAAKEFSSSGSMASCPRMYSQRDYRGNRLKLTSISRQFYKHSYDHQRTW